MNLHGTDSPPTHTTHNTHSIRRNRNRVTESQSHSHIAERAYAFRGLGMALVYVYPVGYPDVSSQTRPFCFVKGRASFFFTIERWRSCLPTGHAVHVQLGAFVKLPSAS